jgi:hypothetical protein
LVKLIGVDAFNLLFGASPKGMTGAFEGMALGGAIGLACYISCLRLSPAPFRAALVGALATGVVGAIIPLLGGRMMGGSLEMLTQSFPDSQLTVGRIGLLLGDNGFHGLTQAVTGGLEGLLFGGCIVGGIARACMRR